jgi:hypothetical protein
MNQDLPTHIRATVESICESGCDRVNQVIEQLESGKTVAEMSGLDQSDQQQVLRELKDIMAVYNRHPA